MILDNSSSNPIFQSFLMLIISLLPIFFVSLFLSKYLFYCFYSAILLSWFFRSIRWLSILIRSRRHLLMMEVQTWQIIEEATCVLIWRGVAWCIIICRSIKDIKRCIILRWISIILECLIKSRRCLLLLFRLLWEIVMIIPTWTNIFLFVFFL